MSAAGLDAIYGIWLASDKQGHGLLATRKIKGLAQPSW